MDKCNELSVGFGATKITDPDMISSDVTKIKIPNEFQIGSDRYNIALLRMAVKMDSKNVQPIALPTDDFPNGQSGAVLVSSGFGNTLVRLFPFMKESSSE